MSVLTRIKNNQILDATIYANAKIVPGSIVGSLFNSNLTTTSDVTIGGNLTVLGTSQYATIASTNTYVNDPLIVVNNAFSGVNTYDLGLLFNRGSLTNQALFWSEFNKEFRLVGTTEAGTTYGNVAASTYANIRLGNLITTYSVQVGTNVDVQSGLTVRGNAFINGGPVGSIRTDATTFNLFNDTATTVNAFGAGTLNTIGATSGTLVLNNPTVVGSQSTQNVFNANATTVNAFQAATSLNVGANSGTLTIGNPTVVGTQSTQNLYNSTATTLNFAGAATTLSIGASTGTTTFNSVTDSTYENDGSVIFKGGVAINKNLNVGANVIIDGNLFVRGSTTTVDSITLRTQDNIIEINTGANGAPLLSDTLNDQGVRAHYFEAGIDKAMYFGRVRTNGYFEVYANVTESTGNISGTLGTIRTGNIITTSNVTMTANGPTGTPTNGFLNLLDGMRLTIGANLNANVIFPEDRNYFGYNSNGIVATTMQNISTGSLAAAEFRVLQSTGGNLSVGNPGLLRMGIGGDNRADPQEPIFGPGDAFIIGTGDRPNSLLQANTVVFSGGDMKFAINSPVDANVYMMINHLEANVTVITTTKSTSPTTGSFQVNGGVGFNANLNVAKGAVINYGNNSGVDARFQVKGTGASTLIYTVPGIDVVSIGGSNVTPASGITAQFNGTGAIIVPTGTTLQRPGTAGNIDVQGMLRLNSSTNNLEYYAGGTWSVAGSSFTIIAVDAFNGDGSTVAFTLGASATSAGTIVSINGIVQIPTTAYSISGTTLTFTEAPATGDVIDVRRLTTTATVSSLSSGYTIFDTNTNWANIQTGNVGAGSVDRIMINSTNDVIFNGVKLIYNNVAPANVTVAADLTLLDRFSANTYTTAKYIVSVKQGGTANVQAMEALLVQNTTSAWVTTYGIVNNGNTMGTLAANVDQTSSPWQCSLWLIPNAGTAWANVKVQPNYIAS
jgi:hypothetical protein